MDKILLKNNLIELQDLDLKIEIEIVLLKKHLRKESNLIFLLLVL